MCFVNYNDRTQTPARPFPKLPRSICRSFPSAPVEAIVVCHAQDLCDQAGADGLVSVSQREPLAFLQNHWLPERQRQGGVVTGHHHFLKSGGEGGGALSVNTGNESILKTTNNKYAFFLSGRFQLPVYELYLPPQFPVSNICH